MLQRRKFPGRATSLRVLLVLLLLFAVTAKALPAMGDLQASAVAAPGARQDTLAAGAMPGNPAEIPAVADATATGISLNHAGKLIVIGFLGGRVHATNLVHREAQLIGSLQQDYPIGIRAAIFANSDGDAALKTVLGLLDEDRDGHLSDGEKSAARIVIYGHSWGASETVTLADRLDKLGIPVLLTIQVDSVQKQSENDQQIPPNVREAVNFYQSEGLLRGRSRIVAADPAKTRILGNRESSYRRNPVSVAGFPWYARAFMRRHIQIENDPRVWNQIEALILAKLL